MITITAYTEPITLPSPQIVETPITEESEDDEEQPQFAEILAGLLKKNEIVDPVVFPPGSFDNEGFETLAEFPDMELQSDLLAGIGENGEIVENVFPDIGFPLDGSLELSAEALEANANHLFTRLEPRLSDDISEAASAEISVKRPENILAQTESDRDFTFFAEAQTEETNLAVETYASVENSEASSFSRVHNKKDKVSVKDEKNLDAKEKITQEPYLVNKKADAPSRLDEMRNRSRRDKVTFEVHDLRTPGGNEDAGARVVETSTGRAGNSAPVREITLELRLPDHNPSLLNNSSQTSWEAKASSALENMLARELHENFNGDIVRHASMALRDGGEGTIRIVLKPESLGNVKIRLEMTENKITGQIVVESEDALNAFRKELFALEQAFKDSGFTNADLNLSLSGEGRQQEQEESSFALQTAALRYDGSVEHEAYSYDVFFGRNGSINILA